MDTSRQKAWSILTENVQEKSLLHHCEAVEKAMRAYAGKFGEDIEYWGAVGLLHDVDFQRYPDEHPRHAGDLLKREYERFQKGRSSLFMLYRKI